MRIKEEKRLAVIGKLIRIYRKEMRGMTMRKFCEGICSINTLRSIEEGNSSRSQEIYEELLARFDLRFDAFDFVDEALEKVSENVKNAILYYRSDQIQKQMSSVMTLLEKVKEYVYYNELFTLFDALKAYYLEDRIISETTAEHFIAVMDLMDPAFLDLYKILIFGRIQIDASQNRKAYQQNIKMMQLENSRSLIIQIMLLHYYFLSGQLVTMKQSIETLEQQFSRDGNDVRLLDVYNYAIALFSLIEVEQRQQYIDKMKKLMDSDKIPDIKKSESCGNIASVLHNSEQYEEALYYCEQMIQYYDDVYLPILIYMAHCQRKLQKKLCLPKVDPAYLKKYSKGLQLMYQYFSSYDANSDMEKLQKIMKDILPHLNDDELIRIFYDEVRELVEKTNSYKYLYMFDKTVNKRMKN